MGFNKYHIIEIKGAEKNVIVPQNNVGFRINEEGNKLRVIAKFKKKRYSI